MKSNTHSPATFPSPTLTLTRKGAVMGCLFQQHEAHVPYLLHFLIDYNLHGMNFIDVSDLRFRQPLPVCSVGCVGRGRRDERDGM